MVRVFLALGSNLGDRLSYLKSARQALAQLPETTITGASTIYETQAVGGPPGQADYLNAVLALETGLSPLDLLAACQAIEKRLDRVRTEHWGPRTVDIDILLYGSESIDHAQLIVPHPRLHQRRFVLAPLAELAADLIHPTLRLSCRQLLESLPPGESVTPFAEKW